MRRKNFRGGRCEKRLLTKCKQICRTYSAIQSKYADTLEENENIREFQCNVYLDGLPDGEYTTDFVCVLIDGEIMVRECVERKHLTKPLTVKLLDASWNYWQKRGVKDWGIVINEEE